eukprot:4761906-Pleurochrysis_carterae.AAC.4
MLQLGGLLTRTNILYLEFSTDTIRNVHNRCIAELISDNPISMAINLAGRSCDAHLINRYTFNFPPYGFALHAINDDARSCITITSNDACETRLICSEQIAKRWPSPLPATFASGLMSDSAKMPRLSKQ